LASRTHAPQQPNTGERIVTTWTVGRRMVAGFIGVLSVTVLLSAFFWLSVARIKGDADFITKDVLPGVELSAKIVERVRHNYALSVEHVSAPDAELMKGLDKQIEVTTAEINDLFVRYEATITQPEDRKLFEQVKPAQQQYRKVRNDEVLALSRAGKNFEAYQALGQKLAPSRDAYLATLDALVKLNHDNATRSSASIESMLSWTRHAVIWGLVLSIGAAGAMSWFIVRGTNRVLTDAVAELTESSHQVTSASGQVASSSQALSQGATEQAASLEETSASMEEMAAMTRHNAENTHQAAALMGEVDAQVKGSNGALGDMVASMTSIRESSAKVAKIIKTIDEIAFQTNILALNAAVEAARAGEAGMGFAVVADEVRSLAQRSAQAAKDTASLIEESSSRAQQGGVKVEQVAASITAITESVSKVKGLVEEVSVASRQQAQGIDQVTQAIAQMEKVTQSTAATAEESAAASEELSAQAETAMTVVARLRALVDGASTAGAPAAPAATAAASRGGRRPTQVSVVRRTAAPSAEDLLPLEDTGTHGRF
jgi:methyl-accepting chemotaxis protein